MPAGFTLVVHDRLHTTRDCSNLRFADQFYGIADDPYESWWTLDDLATYSKSRCTACAPTRSQVRHLLDVDTFGTPRRWALLTSDTGARRWPAELLTSQLPGSHLGTRHAMVPVPVSTLVDLGHSLDAGWRLSDDRLAPVPPDLAARQALASTTVALLDEDTTAMTAPQAFAAALALLDLDQDG